MAWKWQAPRWYLAPTPQPAAGAEFVYTPTGLGFQRIWSLCFTFTASAAVPVRTPTLRLSDGNQTFWRWGAPATVAALGSVPYCGFEGANPAVSANGIVTFELPHTGLYLRQGDVLSTVTAGLDVADQYSLVGMMIEEWPSGPDFRMVPSDDMYAEPLES